eukprot:gene4970-6191_t
MNSSSSSRTTFRRFGVQVYSSTDNQQQVIVNSNGYRLSVSPFYFKNRVSLLQSSSKSTTTTAPTTTTNKPLNQSNTTAQPPPLSSSSLVDDAGIGRQLNQSIFDIFARSRFLSSLSHENLVEFITAEPSKKHHDQILVISEDYENSLSKEIEKQLINKTPITSDRIGEIAYQILKGLVYLHQNKLTHRNLSIENIKLDTNNEIKLTGYGLFYLSSEGETVQFPIGNLLYHSPESILRGLKGSSNSKCDIWAFGCILLHVCFGYCIWDSDNPSVVINRILYLSGLPSTQTFNSNTNQFEECTIDESLENLKQKKIQYIARQKQQEEEQRQLEIDENEITNNSNNNNNDNINSSTKLNSINIKSFFESISNFSSNNISGIGFSRLSSELQEIIIRCLTPNPMDRPSSSQLIDHPYFQMIKKTDPYQPEWIIKPFIKSMNLPDDLSTVDFSVESNQKTQSKDHDIFNGTEIYYLWKLMGGDIEKELVRQGFAKPSPSVHKLPLFVPVKRAITESTCDFTDSLHMAAASSQPNIIQSKNSIIFNNETCLIDISALLSIFTSAYKQNLNIHSDFSDSIFNPTNNNSSSNGKDNDVEYQIIRIREFHKLLYGYQFEDPTQSQPQIIRLAQKGIPSVLRGDIWAAILSVNDHESVQLFNSINLDQKGPNDKQFEVDIPRCHQYHPLLSSKQGHYQLFRLLKAWTILNIEKGCYWQGLDNVASPFVVHHFFNESKSFACLKSFVDKYLKILYVPNNYASLSDMMLTYQQLLSYHDPEVSNHIHQIQLEPNFYAIPWFITIFAHLFPIDKIDILWDTILLGPSSLPYFIAVSIICQFRSYILKSNLENCIKIISKISSADVHLCVKNAIDKFNNTPLSTTVSKFVPDTDPELWWMQEVPIEKRNLEHFPRIGIHDLINSPNSKIFDIRPSNLYQQLHYPNSININPKNGKLQNQLEQFKGQSIVVISPNRDDEGVEFCNQLIKWNFPYVSLLNGGMDALEHGASSLLISNSQ